MLPEPLKSVSKTAVSNSSTGNTRVKAALGDGVHAGITIGKAF